MTRGEELALRLVACVTARRDAYQAMDLAGLDEYEGACRNFADAYQRVVAAIDGGAS